MIWCAQIRDLHACPTEKTSPSGSAVLADAGAEDVTRLLDAAHTLGAHLLMKRVEVRDAQSDGRGPGAKVPALPRIVAGFGSVKRQRNLAAREFGPSWRLESLCEAERVPVEGERALHVADVDDGVVDQHLNLASHRRVRLVP